MGRNIRLLKVEEQKKQTTPKKGLNHKNSPTKTSEKKPQKKATPLPRTKRTTTEPDPQENQPNEKLNAQLSSTLPP